MCHFPTGPFVNLGVGSHLLKIEYDNENNYLYLEGVSIIYCFVLLTNPTVDNSKLFPLQEIWLLATNISVTTLNSLLISQYQQQLLIVVANFPKQTNTNDDFGVVADKSSLI